MFEIGPFRLDLIDDGFFELKPDSFVESQRAEAARGVRLKRRIRVGFNSLLVRGNGHTIVIDPGTGDKPRRDVIRAYHMEWPRKFFPTLRELGVSPENVDTVILTHLHWDHCGGATSLDASGQPIPVFFNARHYVQLRELNFAGVAVANGDDGIFADDFEPLARTGLLETVEGNAEIIPGITLEWTGGHSPGHQIVRISGGSGRGAIYLSDLVPTVAQIPLDSVMSYDANVEEIISAKKRVLGEAAERGDLLMFVHAPKQRAGYLRRDANGEFSFEAVSF